MSEQTARWDSIYDKANKAAQSRCDECDARRNYVCTYHNGWADGFETAMALFEIGAQK